MTQFRTETTYQSPRGTFLVQSTCIRGNLNIPQPLKYASPKFRDFAFPAYLSPQCILHRNVLFVYSAFEEVFSLFEICLQSHHFFHCLALFLPPFLRRDNLRCLRVSLAIADKIVGMRLSPLLSTYSSGIEKSNPRTFTVLMDSTVISGSKVWMRNTLKTSD
jgi:hypothetical protein